MQQYPVQPIDLKPFQKMFVVCATLPTILLMMTFVLWVMLQDPTEPTSTVPTIQVVIFAVLAIGAVAAAPYVRRKMLADTGPIRMNTGDLLEGEGAALQRISMAAIVGMALPEISLLLGFVLGFSAMSWTLYIPFATLTALGWAYMYPRPAQVRAWYARQMGLDSMPGSVG